MILSCILVTKHKHVIQVKVFWVVTPCRIPVFQRSMLMESARTSGTLNGVTTQKTLNLHRRENLSCRIAMYLFFSAFTSGHFLYHYRGQLKQKYNACSCRCTSPSPPHYQLAVSFHSRYWRDKMHEYHGRQTIKLSSRSETSINATAFRINLPYAASSHHLASFA